MIKCCLYFEKKHSEKKNRDYLGSYIVVGSSTSLINLDRADIACILNKGIREIEELPVGFKSQEFPINI